LAFPTPKFQILNRLLHFFFHGQRLGQKQNQLFKVFGRDGRIVLDYDPFDISRFIIDDVVISVYEICFLPVIGFPLKLDI
jgi:hypothetical protein